MPEFAPTNTTTNSLDSENETTSMGRSQSAPTFQLQAGPGSPNPPDGPQSTIAPPDSTPQPEFLPLMDPWENGNYVTQGDPEWEPLINALLDPENPGGWHSALPQAPDMDLEHGHDGVPERRTMRGRVTRERVEPTIANYPDAPTMVPEDDGTARISRAALIQQMQARLSNVTLPGRDGNLPMHRSGGYAYMATRNMENQDSADYISHIRGLTIEDLGYDSVSTNQRRIWPLFHFIMQEGDPSAINAWDGEHITLGSGWSADTDSLNGGMVLNRLPAAYRRQLYSVGIHVEGSDGPIANQLTVLDFGTGSVMHGEDALVLLSADQQRLGFLINAAQSQEQMSNDDNTESTPQANWMVRAQFEQFIRNNRISPAMFAWPQRSLRFAVKLHHWMGSLGWPGLESHGPNVNTLANHAYSRLLPRWTGREDRLRDKIYRIAGRHGIRIPRSAITLPGETE